MPLFSPPFSVVLFHDVQTVFLCPSQVRSVAPQDDSRPLPAATPLRISDPPILRAAYTQPPSTTRSPTSWITPLCRSQIGGSRARRMWRSWGVPMEALFMFNMIVGDSVVIWRVWAIYARMQRWVVSLPVLMLVMSFAFTIIDINCLTSSSFSSQSALAGGGGVCDHAELISVVQRTPSGGLSVPPPPSHHPGDRCGAAHPKTRLTGSRNQDQHPFSLFTF
ncbi:hypothetical protein R3P38DRAFT_3289931 [Favolaschia claudopus]|uniref:Uncharacterized protein n=1 Tax=Favolaschia claudopus TaxID=2862362 RepID=A0AAV9ZTV4_9AGAR